MNTKAATPIFHTGFHKTATTFLQKNFWPRVKNYRYVVSGEVKDSILAPFELGFDAAAVRKSILDDNGMNFICSNEEFSANPRLGGYNGLALAASYRRIHSVFPEARIVVFIREQVDMIKSLYLQYIKMGGTMPLAKFLRPNSRNRMLNPGFCLEYYAYDRLLDWITELFGRKSLHVYSYGEFRSDCDGLTSCMCRDLDLQIDKSMAKTEPDNISMRRYSLSVSRFFNHFTRDLVGFEKKYILHLPEFYRLIRLAARTMDGFDSLNPKIDAKKLMGEGLFNELRDYYSTSNRRLEEKYGIAL